MQYVNYAYNQNIFKSKRQLLYLQMLCMNYNYIFEIPSGSRLKCEFCGVLFVIQFKWYAYCEIAILKYI